MRLPQIKVDRLAALAEAAKAGRLDRARLRSLGAEEGCASLQELPGIGRSAPS